MERLFNPDMLILAREAREYSQADLGRIIAVNQGTISKIESGVLQPSDQIVAAAATTLGVPVSFFEQRDRVYGFNSSVFFHRKRQSLPDRVLRRLHAYMNLTRMRVHRLLRSYPSQSEVQFKRIPVGEYQGGAAQIAKVVRANWLLPHGPVRSVMDAIEFAGGIVVCYAFGTRQADAISEWVPGFPPIFLVNSDPDIPGDRLRLTLAHELGHVVMHESASANMEREANEFAAEFLAPRREIKPSLFALNMDKLGLLKRQWKMSMQALIERAHDLGTITDAQRRYLYINISKRSGSRIHEPFEGDVPVEKPALFDRLISQHINQLGYSARDLAQVLFFSDTDQFKAELMGERKLRLVEG